ncbi:DUF262 domain-containing protein [Pantoea agglomerans]|uniref:DUF262 domain-containing protein n=1 Tax=Enterobacter agglomerans TaxID=549 RepID=UPI003C7BFBA3
MSDNLELDFVEDENQKENDEDLAFTRPQDFSAAVVSGSDWTTETIISQINKNNIELDPRFQRRDAWDKKRKSKFIESLILGFPIPQIVLAEKKDKKGSFIVLDGKQRLLSIRQFSAEKQDLIYNQLKLTSLEIRKDLNGNSLTSIQNNPLLDEELSSFENQTIRTIVIRNWPSEDFLYHVFLRLNTGSVPLSPQELRQALHPGNFINYLDDKSADSIALKEILKLQKPDFRMRDNELMLRYIAYANFFESYSGNLKLFLDNCCKFLNKEWSIREMVLDEQITNFELAHQRLKDIFRKNLYRKWIRTGYETRFNRAIFDIMIHSFCDKNVRELTKGRESEVENIFKDLCTQNIEFLDSLETTTKSLNAVVTRFTNWNEKLNSVFGTNLPEYKLHDNKIIRVR